MGLGVEVDDALCEVEVGGAKAAEFGDGAAIDLSPPQAPPPVVSCACLVREPPNGSLVIENEASCEDNRAWSWCTALS
ncbi:hypothetical protein GCM10010207_80480 [Streptomyces atratus]|nr:hypothetical protein GCM10010207_80480 [Streptomyces atratus]